MPAPSPVHPLCVCVLLRGGCEGSVIGVVGEPGGSRRGECVRGAINNRASHRSPRSRHRRAHNLSADARGVQLSPFMHIHIIYRRSVRVRVRSRCGLTRAISSNMCIYLSLSPSLVSLSLSSWLSIYRSLYTYIYIIITAAPSECASDRGAEAASYVFKCIYL